MTRLLAPRRLRLPARGLGLPEILVVLLVSSSLSVLATPHLRRLYRDAAFRSALREIAMALGRARYQAVAAGRNVAVRWEPGPQGVTYALYADGNGDGVTNRDIVRKVDRRLSAPASLRSLEVGTTISFLPGWVEPDPSGRSIGEDPVKFNRSSLSSFSPVGGATPGSIYLADGVDRQAVIRVSSAAKVSTLVWDRRQRRWVQP